MDVKNQAAAVSLAGLDHLVNKLSQEHDPAFADVEGLL